MSSFKDRSRGWDFWCTEDSSRSHRSTVRFEGPRLPHGSRSLEAFLQQGSSKREHAFSTSLLRLLPARGSADESMLHGTIA